MFSNACVLILQKIDKTELRALKAFVKRRVPPQNQEYILFDYLCNCHPEFKEKDLAPEKIAELFKETSWSNPAKRLSSIGNELTRILEEYLVEQALKKNWDEYEFLLAYEYSRLGLPELLDRKIDNYLNPPESTNADGKKKKIKGEKKPTAENSEKETNKKNPARGGIGVWHHLNLSRMYYLRYYSRDTVKTAPEQNNLDLSWEQLEQAYLATKLRIALEMASIKSMNGKTPLVVFSDEELETLKARLTEKDVFLYLYCHAYDLMAHPSDEKFYNLKLQLLKLGKHLSKVEQGNLLTPLINYASTAIRNGQDEFYAEASFLHHYGLDTGVLLQDGKITPELLINVINLTCEAHELEKASALLAKWTPNLPTSLQEEGLFALNGRIEFYSKNYRAASGEFFQTKRFTHHFIELIARTTTVQSYFELQEYDLLSSFCINFAKTLSRSDDRFSPHHQDSYGNFIKMVQALIKVKQNPNADIPKVQEKLRQKIAKKGALVCKKWLLQKIDALKLTSRPAK